MLKDDKSYINELREIKRLLDENIITQDEFDDVKKRILKGENSK